MLYVCNLAGEELAALDAEELHDVKHLKKVLDQRLGVSRFHQRLLQGGALLEDHVTLTPVGFDTVQLVVAPFVEASREDVEMLIESSRRGRIVDLEMMLQQPYDPNLQRADGDYAPGWTFYCSFPRHVKNTFNSVNGKSLGETV